MQDQRTAATRPDVLVYRTPILDHSTRFAGVSVADLFVRTTGTDPTQPEMGGYQLPVSLDIFRGRYRHSFEHPSPAGQVQQYGFRLPTLNYMLQPGYQLMVHVQSTLFPFYDRKPTCPASCSRSQRTTILPPRPSSMVPGPAAPCCCRSCEPPRLPVELSCSRG